MRNEIPGAAAAPPPAPVPGPPAPARPAAPAPPPAPVPGPPARPVLAVVRGNPSPAELAAVVAVLGARARCAAAAGSAPGPAGGSRSHWSDRSRLLRDPLSPGPGAWKRSALPR